MTIVVLVVFIENGITSTTPKNALKDKSTLTMAHAPYEWDFISSYNKNQKQFENHWIRRKRNNGIIGKANLKPTSKPTGINGFLDEKNFEEAAKIRNRASQQLYEDAKDAMKGNGVKERSADGNQSLLKEIGLISEDDAPKPSIHFRSNIGGNERLRSREWYDNAIQSTSLLSLFGYTMAAIMVLSLIVIGALVAISWLEQTPAKLIANDANVKKNVFSSDCGEPSETSKPI
ncbi:hypothetical protein BLOT_008847 [Blomia tropicalis]|nr:hypothetical protein BLOT_008847 [Blomia tropicalis]